MSTRETLLYTAMQSACRNALEYAKRISQRPVCAAHLANHNVQVLSHDHNVQVLSHDHYAERISQLATSRPDYNSLRVNLSGLSTAPWARQPESRGVTHARHTHACA